jgi:hypothetical protein
MRGMLATIEFRIFSLPVSYLKIMLSPVVMYGCETWLVTLKEDHRLRVSENRVPRRIFGPKWEELA